MQDTKWPLLKGQHTEKCEKGRVCKITNNSYAFHTFLLPTTLKKKIQEVPIM